MNHFGVRPYPEANESLQGYLLRLAWLNGITHLERLLTLIGLPRYMSNNAAFWDQGKCLSVIEALAPWLKRAREQVFPNLKAQMKLPWCLEQCRLIQDLHLSHLRLCPACLVEHGVLDWRWSLAPVAHCPDHQCLLLDACPHCQAPFKLHSTLLTQCPSCAYKWGSHRSSTESLTPLEVSIYANITISKAQNTRDIDALTITIACLARPYDSILARRHRLPVMQDYSRLVAHAYHVLQSPCEQATWAQSCRQERASLQLFGERVILHPILHWKHQLQRIRYPLAEIDIPPLDVKTATPPLREYNAMIPKRRLVDNTACEPRYQFSDHELDTLFEQQVLSKTVLIDTLAPCEKTRRNKHLINLAKLAQQLQILISPAPSDWIRVEQSTEALPLWLTSYATLIQAVLHGAVDGRLNDLTFTAVWLAPDTFSQWLESQLRLACKESIPVFELKHRFNCDQASLLIYIHEVQHINDEPSRQYTLVKHLQQRQRSLSGESDYV